MIFSISEALDQAAKISPETFIGLGIWERRHIEEWIRSNPEILGEKLLILTTEFDRFTTSSDRLDLLALDQKGNLVIVELKRDLAAGYADLQAIRYAAMVSSMTIKKLLPYFAAYRKKYHNEQIDEAAASDLIGEFVSGPLSDFSTKLRIILCSEDFSQEITTTVLWLRTFKVDITCVKITPYKVRDQVIIVPKVLIPLEKAEKYLVEVKEKEEERERSTRVGALRTLQLLISNQLVNVGDVVKLKAELPSYVNFVEGDPTFEALITGNPGPTNGLQWNKDGKEYSLSALASRIFRDMHPEKKGGAGISGKWHWVAANGRSLGQMEDDWVSGNSE